METTQALIDAKAYEAAYAQRARTAHVRLTKHAIPCRCGSPMCSGWKMTQGRPEDTVGLIYFAGGALDGKAYRTEDLLTVAALSLPLTEYKWTKDFITSETTGATARVWRHHSLLPQVAVGPMKEDKNG